MDTTLYLAIGMFLSELIIIAVLLWYSKSLSDRNGELIKQVLLMSDRNSYYEVKAEKEARMPTAGEIKQSQDDRLRTIYDSVIFGGEIDDKQIEQLGLKDGVSG